MRNSMKRLFVLLATFAVVCPPSTAQSDAGAARPPVAKKVPRTFTLHGDVLVDNYYWLREKTSKEVIDYLEAENAYTEAVLKPTAALQDKLYKEMLGRIKQT